MTRDEIKEIFEQAIERPIRDQDEYFSVGGDSLSSVEILESVRQLYGVEMPPSVFLQCSSIGSLLTLFVDRIDGSDSTASRQ